MNASPPKFLDGWFDGSSGNPDRPPRAAWLLEDGNGFSLSGIVTEAGQTSVTAEYHGLIDLLKYLKTNPPPARTKIYIRGDSLLVFNQVKGIWGVGQPHLEPLQTAAAGLLFDLEESGIECNLVWIPRSGNKAHYVLHPPGKPGPKPKKKD